MLCSFRLTRIEGKFAVLRLSRRLVALLTFGIGLFAVSFFQPPGALHGVYRVVVPPVPVQLTHEEIAVLPNSCGTLVVSIAKDGNLKLNESDVIGSVERPEAMIEKLGGIFRERTDNRAYKQGMEYRPDLPESERILREVVVRSPLSVPYGDVAKVIDAVKAAGASPVVLQLDELPH